MARWHPFMQRSKGSPAASESVMYVLLGWATRMPKPTFGPGTFETFFNSVLAMVVQVLFVSATRITATGGFVLMYREAGACARNAQLRYALGAMALLGWEAFCTLAFVVCAALPWR